MIVLKILEDEILIYSNEIRTVFDYPSSLSYVRKNFLKKFHWASNFSCFLKIQFSFFSNFSKKIQHVNNKKDGFIETLQQSTK